MTFFQAIPTMLAFRSRAVRALAGRKPVLPGLVLMVGGYLAFVLVRNFVHAGSGPPLERPFLLFLFQLNLIQALLFLSLVYIPALICLSNAFAGDGLGFSSSREEYQIHISVLFPLWGALLLIGACLQWSLPHFLILGVLEISVGLLGLVSLIGIYTVWAIKELNYISTTAALGAFVVSWFALPVFYLLSIFILALPLFIMIPALYFGFQYLRVFFAARSREREFQQHLHSLTLNPQDADAHHQLGLIHLRRGDLDTAEISFGNAMRIDSHDPDYHYYLGRVFEEKQDWSKALQQYEETYCLNHEYAMGDIFREVGKGYLQTGRLDKAEEFLQFFLNARGSDPEGRYWLAVTYQRLGRNEEMRAQLRTLLDQARSNPRFFRKEKRRWLYRARILLRQSASG